MALLNQDMTRRRDVAMLRLYKNVCTHNLTPFSNASHYHKRSVEQIAQAPDLTVEQVRQAAGNQSNKQQSDRFLSL
ncbi:hypothetical protein [Fischerella thermalis]|uniref:hypothetical protein n=1 Tax=Fischerella thermalis TaxID=372787 RepID=UPI000E0BEF6C|nr:hypothetical protein [Fischerella thermalis]RDH49876.1 hypothetical protein CA946_09200 [Fischerella thermalis 111/344/542]